METKRGSNNRMETEEIRTRLTLLSMLASPEPPPQYTTAVSLHSSPEPPQSHSTRIAELELEDAICLTSRSRRLRYRSHRRHHRQNRRR
jgi:hypothetical protein